MRIARIIIADSTTIATTIPPITIPAICPSVRTSSFITDVGGGGEVVGSSTEMLAVTGKQTSYIAVLCTLLILFGLAVGSLISYAERS